MRNIYSNNELAHPWAHNLQYSARNSGGSFFFDGTVIYSYGRHFPIAQRLDADTFLMTTQGYSVTTAAHITHVRRAIPRDATVYHVDNPTPHDKSDHKANAAEMRKEIDALIEKASRARSNKETLVYEAGARINEHNRYIKQFKLGLRALSLDGIDFDAIKEAAAKRRAAAKRKAAAVEKRQLKDAAEIIQAWQAGDARRIPYGIEKVFLRVKDNEVETSKGVSFPASHAPLIWRVVNRCVKNREAWHANGHTIKLGHYNVDRISATGTITAGCHVVEYDQALYIAQCLNLV